VISLILGLFRLVDAAADVVVPVPLNYLESGVIDLIELLLLPLALKLNPAAGDGSRWFLLSSSVKT